MAVRKIKENIYSVGANDWDRELFDELIPLSEGTSYNSYLIKGSEKTVLIDTVEPAKEKKLIRNLNELQVKKIDYLVSNHAEQDHSGTIPKVLKIYPEAKLVTNEKCKDFLQELLLISEDKFKIVSDGETLSLGDKTLKFLITPWVHWPETMVTYLQEDNILFSCDFFGSHLATSDLFVADEKLVYLPAKQYYAEIMMPFRQIIKKNIEKIKDIKIDMIAPSHGPIYKNPAFIIDLYKEWISDSVKNEVVIPYVSMHGSTETMVNYFIDALIEKGIGVKPFNMSRLETGELSIALVDAATIVIGTPTVLVNAHPNMVYAAYLVSVLRPKFKFGSIIGSYGWRGKMPEQIKDLLSNLKFELLEPVITRGYPKGDDFKQIDRLTEDIFKKHKEINII